MGRTIAHYRILALLGEGGMGVVYRAVDERLHRTVALKLLADELLADEEARRRFLREARAAAALDHPNAGAVYEAGEAHGVLFIAMPLYEGEGLDRRLARESRLPSAEVRDLMVQLTSALGAAHRAGIVHRDVKPSNVILTPSRQIKLLDFGLARFLGHTVTTLTERGVLLGTLSYMSPEQCRGEDLDGRADLWAVGVIAYEALAGRRPFDAGSAVGTMHRIIYEEPRPLLLDRPDLSVEFGELIEDLLRKDRDARVRNAEALLVRLGALPAAPVEGPQSPPPESSDLGNAPTATHEGPWPSPPPERPVTNSEPQRAPPRRRTILGVAGAITLTVLILAALWLPPRLRPDPLPAPSGPLEVIPIPGGTFVLGSSPAEIAAAKEYCILGLGKDQCRGSIYEREQPAQTVMLSPYGLDRTEVTNGAFAAWLNRRPGVVEVEGSSEPGDRHVADENGILVHLYPRYGVFGIAREEGRYVARRGYERSPVTQVSWRAAQEFCRDRGGRLPTEAEWERAARGPRGDRFPWGDGEPTCDGVRHARNSGGACHDGVSTGPAPVATSPQDTSVDGVLDLGGNVAEWVLDQFAERYPTCAPPCQDPATLFVLADGAPFRVVRGGSFDRAAEACRGAGRMRRRGNDVLGDVGFRCAYPKGGEPPWPAPF